MISSHASRLGVAAICCLSFVGTASAQDAPKPKPKTTENVDIPTDQLAILVKPLTASELGVEADAWLDLLKAKQQEITDTRLNVKSKSEEVKEAKEEAGQAKSADGDAGEGDDGDAGNGDAGNGDAGNGDAGNGDDANSETPEEAAEKAEGEKKQELENLNVLQEQRSSLIERLEIVLKELELKGGSPENYRTYVAAISGGLEVDVTDASAVWIAITGWIQRDDGGIKWGKNLASFAGLIILFWFLSKLAGRLVERALRAAKRLSTLLREFIVKMSIRIVFVVGVVIAVSALGVNVGPFLAVIGAAGFVVAFALQGTLSNFASGIMILLYRPFDVGDAVEVAGVSGKVIQLNLVSTRIHTPDNKVLFVPNNSVWNNIITNITGSATRRVDLVFGIGYDDDIGKAMEVLKDLVSSHEQILEDPAPTIEVHELADSSVNIICRPWTKTEDYWKVYWYLHRTVKERFDKEGLSIPYPQQDVHMHQAS